MSTQRLVTSDGSVYVTAPVLAGPHTWEIGDYQFTTVVVKCHGDVRGWLSVIDVRSGMRVGRAQIRAPKTKPHAAMYAVSRLIDELRTTKGDAVVVAKLKSAPKLP